MTQTATSALTVLDLPDGERGLIGLAGISTDAQDAQLQQNALTLAGCGPVYIEKVSTRKAATERTGGLLGCGPGDGTDVAVRHRCPTLPGNRLA